jgi:hypothetical protein
VHVCSSVKHPYQQAHPTALHQRQMRVKPQVGVAHTPHVWHTHVPGTCKTAMVCAAMLLCAQARRPDKQPAKNGCRCRHCYNSGITGLMSTSPNLAAAAAAASCVLQRQQHQQEHHTGTQNSPFHTCAAYKACTNKHTQTKTQVCIVRGLSLNPAGVQGTEGWGMAQRPAPHLLLFMTPAWIHKPWSRRGRGGRPKGGVTAAEGCGRAGDTSQASQRADGICAQRGRRRGGTNPQQFSPQRGFCRLRNPRWRSLAPDLSAHRV